MGFTPVGAIKHNPDTKPFREILKVVRCPGRHEYEAARFYCNDFRAIEELPVPFCDYVYLIPVVWLLKINFDR